MGLVLQLGVQRKDDNESDDQSDYENDQHFSAELLLMAFGLLQLGDAAFDVLFDLRNRAADRFNVVALICNKIEA